MPTVADLPEGATYVALTAARPLQTPWTHPRRPPVARAKTRFRARAVAQKNLHLTSLCATAGDGM